MRTPRTTQSLAVKRDFRSLPPVRFVARFGERPTAPRRAALAAQLAILLLGVFSGSVSHAHDIAAEMQQAAERFVKSLNDEQKQVALIPFESDKRQTWHYIPSSMMDAHGGRRGLEFKRLSPQQRVLALGLLNTALSHRGNLQAMTIMALEGILRELENGNPVRDPEMYHVAVYGHPATDRTWGWSVEGHHLSVNLMLVDGQRFSVTPSFWGSNPAVVKAGPFQGLDTLSTEQQLGREFVKSLSPEQQKQAIIAASAPSDIITAAERKVERGKFDPPLGIPFSELDARQRDDLLKLVSQFAAKYRQGIIDQIAQRTPIIDGTGMYFAWAGGLEVGEGHYYRIQTPAFVFEYDNTQNDANHIHTVWRAFDGDFGADLLRKHYEDSPH